MPTRDKDPYDELPDEFEPTANRDPAEQKLQEPYPKNVGPLTHRKQVLKPGGPREDHGMV